MRGGQSGRWAWKGVFAVHHRSGDVPSSCTGRIYQYTYRLHAPEDSRYERCLGMSWCSLCREFSENVGFVSRDTVLWDALSGLEASERESLGRNSRRIREYVDRLVRRGLWAQEPSK
ncbi:hypothetical protein Areg01_60480 [Actinoplanes regularis]|nr:hypothetical protein Areg01_60480 [Actinoplanes regularis]